MLRLRSQGLGAVRTCGAIPPMPMAWVPPVHEATGGYAAPSPCLSPALTYALQLCCAFMFRIFVLLIERFCTYVLQYVLHLCCTDCFAVFCVIKKFVEW